jgi:dihydrofolate reductase
MIKYKIIVAHCKNYGIGLNNDLPWRIPSDLKRFMRLTLDGKKNAIVMGKNTWDSLPKKPLKGRDNLILSSTFEIDNNSSKGITKSFKSIDDIHTFCLEKQYDSVWVIGGESVYNAYLNKNLISEIHLTYIDKDFKCDRFFNMMPYNFQLFTSETTFENGLKIEYKTLVNTNIHKYKYYETEFKKTIDIPIENLLQGEYNIIKSKKEKGYFHELTKNDAHYIRDLTLDINFSLKKFVEFVCNTVLNVNSTVIFKYNLSVEKDKWTVRYYNCFPIKGEVIFEFTKLDEYRTNSVFTIKTEIPEKFYTDSYLNFGKMMRPFMLDNYINLIEKYYSKS